MRESRVRIKGLSFEADAQGYGSTAGRILDAAELLVQQRGFNGFSYADIASELDVTKPALHYHFSSKADLGVALVERYRARFNVQLSELESRGEPATETLAAYAELYAAVLEQGRLCLCGMLAAEFFTLPTPMRDSVLAFFADNETWLTGVLTRGRDDGSLVFSGAPGAVSSLIVGSLEGAMLVARAHNDTNRFRAAITGLLQGLQR